MKRTSNATAWCAALCSAAVTLTASAKPPTITLDTLSSVRTTPRNNGATPPVLSPAGASIILTYDSARQRLLVVNQVNSRIEVIDISNPAAPAAQTPLDMSSYGPLTTSVAVYEDLLAVAVTGPAITDPGAGRSFSILSASGQMLWDSGSQFETTIAAQLPLFFNVSNTNNIFDDRSDDKGPEPEGVALGKAFGRNYAFIGLERLGGVMVYDISTPKAPEFVEYAYNRDFTVPVALDAAGDLGAEGMVFIKADDSPNGSPLLAVANEVSGTTTIFQLRKVR